MRWAPAGVIVLLLLIVCAAVASAASAAVFAAPPAPLLLAAEAGPAMPGPGMACASLPCHHHGARHDMGTCCGCGLTGGWLTASAAPAVTRMLAGRPAYGEPAAARAGGLGIAPTDPPPRRGA
ncbi:MAG: hypothetical protein M0Z28_07645 [Rhodospirillales bacterium]|nr:hypothetical protein [Rhodospirillales bacterium]